MPRSFPEEIGKQIPLQKGIVIKMKKELMLNISSLIEDIDDSGLCIGETEKQELRLCGTYEYKSGIARIVYTEKTEGGDVVCKINAKDGAVTVKRLGAAVSEMQFREGDTYHSLYTVPPFSFDMEITTKSMNVCVSEFHTKINLLYEMNIGGQKRLCRFNLEANI